MDTDDPWDWSVDRVVQELCTPNRSWEPGPPTPMPPDPIKFEEALREQEISGAVLLVDVNDDVLRLDFGLKVARRRFVKSGIDILRLRSARYQADIQRNIPNSVTASTSRQHDGVQPAGISGSLSDAGGAGADMSSNKRRKVDSPDPMGDVEPQYDLPPTQTEDSRPNDGQGPGLPTPPNILDIHGKKRKRIAPTLITSEIDPNRDRHFPTKADSIQLPIIEPGVASVGDDGRKRLMPVRQLDGKPDVAFCYEELLGGPVLDTQPDSISDEALSTATQTKSVKRRKRFVDFLPAGYLGRQKMPADFVFYGHTTVGEDLPPGDVEEFVAAHDISNGRRQYVNSLMQRFLRTKSQTFARQDEYFSAVLPYSPKLAPRFQNQSFTLFYSDVTGKVHARREEVQSWPEVDPNLSTELQRLNGERSATFNPTGPNILEALGNYEEGLDPSYLEKKYKYLEGGDEILPLYGESDEENEYDMETWKEIEEERGGQARIIGRTTKANITSEEVDQAIDDGIAELVQKWKEKILPKRLRKAYNLWRKSRVRGSKREEIIAAQTDLKHILQRVVKMRKEIMNDVWTSRAQVQRQTRIMELDIFSREDLNWRISLLEQKICPDKPLPTPSVAEFKKSHRSNDGEEGDSIQSESEAISSDDGLDDFVVSDELLPTTEQEKHELDFADSEADVDADDGNATMSDISSSDESEPEYLPSIQKKTDQSSSVTRPEAGSDHSMLGADDFQSLSSPTPTPSRTPAIKEEANRAPSRSTAASVGYVDLTLTSSDENLVIDLITPKKTPKIKLMHRNSVLYHQPIRGSATRSSPIQLLDSEEDVQPDLADLPALDDPAAIAGYSFSVWSRMLDKERLLIAVLYKMGSEYRVPMLELVTQLDADSLWTHMRSIMDAYTQKNVRTDNISVKGLDEQTFVYFRTFVNLFHMYMECVYVPWRGVLSPDTIDKVIQEKEEKFADFYDFCEKLVDCFGGVHPASSAEMAIKYRNIKGSAKEIGSVDLDDDEDEDPRPAVRKRAREPIDSDDEAPRSVLKRSSEEMVGSDDDAVPEDTPHSKKRVKKINENKAARELRQQDKERLAEQADRRKRLLEKLGTALDENRDKIIINLVAAEGEKHLYINHHIAQRIKKHQIDGVRFLWNQIVAVEDEEALSGCLLAHTMGLGKTMQVITLLVAIAEASQSIDPAVISQVPVKLRRSQTLVLCPPGLIDNWMDELLTWVPGDILGDLRKVADERTGMKKSTSDRLRVISNWNEDGGVLVIGYEMFRDFVNNKTRKGREFPPLTEEQHEIVKAHLLEGPNIIIADEAHKMKNPISQIAMVASQFRSRTRIALTGSPLNNNVEEYHSMINWVAPNYLGPLTEFRAKYVDPIQAGLYVDSSRYEQRKSMKMLAVLEKDIGPKVNRADMQVLRNDLPQKKEFVITVPLTDLQRKAYSLYVQNVTSAPEVSTTKSGDVTNSTIWQWLAVLSLICNHPKCFDVKLHERKEQAKKRKDLVVEDAPSPVDSTDADTMVVDINAPAWKIGVSETLVTAATRLFHKETLDLESISHSYKVQILCQILDASKSVGDKVLIFSQSLVTLDFLEKMCQTQQRKYARLDGKTPMNRRQELSKAFNAGEKLDVFLISTTAGGLGLNLPSANRVIIFDFKWNPVHEEQAVGRAYRIGQKKDTFVYRFIAGGTFEDSVQNKTIFKMQLASRVVDNKRPIAHASRKIADFLFEPKVIKSEDLTDFEGMDPLVLDKILATPSQRSAVLKIIQTDTFERDDEDAKLTPEEEQETQILLKESREKREDEDLKRKNPVAYNAKMAQRAKAEQAMAAKLWRQDQERLQKIQQQNLATRPQYQQAAQQSVQYTLPATILTSEQSLPQSRTPLSAQQTSGSSMPPASSASTNSLNVGSALTGQLADGPKDTPTNSPPILLLRSREPDPSNAPGVKRPEAAPSPRLPTISRQILATPPPITAPKKAMIIRTPSPEGSTRSSKEPPRNPSKTPSTAPSTTPSTLGFSRPGIFDSTVSQTNNVSTRIPQLAS